MRLSPTPWIPGMFSSMADARVGLSQAPSSSACRCAWAASRTRSAIAASAGVLPGEDSPGSASGCALTIRFIEPWRYSSTSRERCRATAENPIFWSRVPNSCGWEVAYSMNSIPSSPSALLGSGTGSRTVMEFSRDARFGFRVAFVSRGRGIGRLSAARHLRHGIGFKLLVVDPLIRHGVIPLVIATLGLTIGLKNMVKAAYSAEAHPFPYLFPDTLLTVGTLRVSSFDIGTLFVAGLIVFCLQSFLNRTMTGRAMQAVAQNTEAAAVLGINVKRMILYVFLMNALLAAVAAVL